MEIEVKYLINDKQTAETIWQDKILTSMEEAGTRERVFMKAVYFDTEDNALMHKNIAFRVRMEGNRVVATLKWRADREGALHKRQELNVPMCDDVCLISPDLSIFKGSEVGDEVIALIGDRPICNIMEVNMLRSRFRIDTGNSIIEVSLDSGEIITDNGSGPINELELELFSGDTEELLTIGTGLMEKYNLEEGVVSKYARGLKLLKLI